MLEFKEQLGLSPHQAAGIGRIRERMAQETKALVRALWPRRKPEAGRATGLLERHVGADAGPQLAPILDAVEKIFLVFERAFFDEVGGYGLVHAREAHQLI